MANVNLYKSHTRVYFASSYNFRDIHISKFVTLENVGQGHDVQHLQWCHSMANIVCTNFLMAIVMFALSFTVYRIFTNLRKCQNFNFENEWQGQGEKLNLCHSTGNVRFHIDDFFSILATWERAFTQTDNTCTARACMQAHTERQCENYRQNLQSRFV